MSISAWILVSVQSINAQLINYVSNGSFEDCVNCETPPYNATPRSWGPIDSIPSSYYFNYCSLDPPLSNLPYMSTGFQYPRSGRKLIASSFYCDYSSCTYTNNRGYPKNRLKQTLKPNILYCAKYYIVNTNNCVVGIDAYGAYFSDSTLDTIKYHSIPISYLNAQIQNTTGSIIVDTLNWTAISGTFVATGVEKFMVLGNFKSNAATNTLIINPTYLPHKGTDLYIDDVSVFELDAPAYAGPDKTIISGDSVYIGSPRDFAADEVCSWYLLPNTSTPIDTAAAGLWVKPTVTSKYVVRQQLWCSGVKWDTVTVYVDYVGIPGSRSFSSGFGFEVFPNPADEILEIRLSEHKVNTTIPTLRFFNHLGMQVREEEVLFRDGAAKIDVRDLETGIYFIELAVENEVKGRKRILVMR